MARPERVFQRGCGESLNNSKRYAGNDSACEGRVNDKSIRFSGKYAPFLTGVVSLCMFLPRKSFNYIPYPYGLASHPDFFYLDVCSVRTVLLGFKKNII